MKKIFIAIITLTILVCVCACTPTLKDEYEKHISMAHTSLYAGNSDCFYASVTSGIKEVNYEINGTTTETKEFIKLAVLPLSINFFNKTYNFKLIGDKGECSGKLTKDMFGSGYTQNIETLENVGSLCEIIIYEEEDNDNEYSITLQNKMENKLSYKDALEKAKVEFSDLINSENAEGELQREIIIKFINDSKNADNPYYWYVAFAKTNTDYWSILIDAESGNIIAKRT